MIAWYEKFRVKCQEEAKEEYVTISRLDFLNTISSVIASLDADQEEANSLSVFGALIAGKIFGNTDEGEMLSKKEKK